jgi:tetratricopeptide (TPR) repeat protein
MTVESRSARSDLVGTGDSGPGSRSWQKGVFRKAGWYWTVGLGGNEVRLRETRGLGYIAHLLHHPHTEFHVLDLYEGIATRREEDETSQPVQGWPRSDEDLEQAGIRITRGLGDAGEMLDEHAKFAYRRRLSELREELDAAKEVGNVERAELAEQEIDALTKELSRAVGLGGRNRRAASTSERARQSITKSIKSALEKIAQSDATLGDLLSRCIKTGTFCSYQPDPEFPLAWEFAATNLDSPIEPAEQPTSSGDPAPARADRPQTPLVVPDVSPFSLAERTPFVGRETECHAIRGIIDRALAGQGSLVMIGGGPGVGKSRLAMEMGEYASSVEFRCVVGHCYERDDPFPYLPFVEIIESGLAQAASLDDFRRRLGDNAAELAQLAPSLRRAFPDIPQPLELPPAQKRRFLFQGLSAALAHAAQTRSYAFILEDLHWADESTLALLIHLANRITQLPVVIIGTYRDGYLDSNPALIRSLEELIRMGIRPLKVGGLSRNAVGQMLNGLSQRQAPENLVSTIFDHSQGNPFFVEELYRHLHEEGRVFNADDQFRTEIKIDEFDVPDNVKLVIGRRLERLNDNEKRVLAAAAVIGRSFSFRLLTEVAQIDVDELFAVFEKAQQMGIIIPSSEGPERPLTFGHELVRQTLLAGISAPRQQRLHAGAADAIERLYQGAISERARDITDHLLKAGPFADERRLIHYLMLAGKGALDAAAFKEAIRSFRSALSHLSDVDARARADLLAGLAIAERGLENWDAAFTNLQDAFDIYITFGDREMIGKSCAELTAAFIWGAHFKEITETAHRGLAHLEADVSADRARLLAVLGQAQAVAGNWEPAREALNIASKLSDPKLMAELLGAKCIVNYLFLRLEEVAADGERSGESEASPWERAIQLQVLNQALLYLGRPADAARISDELEPLAAKIGQSLTIARCLITRAWVDFGKEPNVAKLETAIHEALKFNPKVSFDFWDAFSEEQLSLVNFFSGNWASALLHAKASSNTEEETFIHGLGVGTLFRQMAYAGDHVEALAILNQKRAWLPGSGRPNTIGSWWMLALVIEGLVILGEQSQAAQLYPLVREFIDTGAIALLPIFRFTHTVAGMAAAAAHQWEAAQDHFRIALRQAETFPHCLEQAEIRRFHSMMLIARSARGDREKAQRLLTEALEAYTQIAMPHHIEMTRMLLHGW